MIGHITYLFEETMEAKFGRKLRSRTSMDTATAWERMAWRAGV
jgi:homoserine acetyltransferase